jgi:hypothetical protein
MVEKTKKNKEKIKCIIRNLVMSPILAWKKTKWEFRFGASPLELWTYSGLGPDNINLIYNTNHMKLPIPQLRRFTHVSMLSSINYIIEKKVPTKR